MFMETSTTPSAPMRRKSARGRPRSSGRAIAQSAADPKSRRRKTTPGGPSDGKSDFATAAPPCTEQAAARMSPTADARLFPERERGTDRKQRDSEQARPVECDPG